ncbi:fibronectin type III-like domain-contianing protein [Streptomyces sp. NBC_01643]|uniref:fibronectin type III-like domain-contianing protein n=1 Tax=Streptomyces sp. NBC_01643 TaxID=2975906 RepID=UPI00386C8CA3|nr:fibronectin type III-like domain-contianing protein [Streptomyces sp. NBC_01643]
MTVRNTGELDGDEVVQLYIRDPVASLVQPVRRLSRFRRVSLAPDASATMRFTLGAEDFGLWTNAPDGEFVIETGSIHLYMSNSSVAGTKLTLTIE